MSLSLLQASSPPDQGGLTPPRPGPHPAGGKRSGHVFWGVLCREEALVFLGWLRPSQQQLEMTQRKEKGQNSEGRTAAWLAEMTRVQSCQVEPIAAKASEGRPPSSRLQAAARPPPHCTVASAHLHVTPKPGISSKAPRYWGHPSYIYVHAEAALPSPSTMPKAQLRAGAL